MLSFQSNVLVLAIALAFAGCQKKTDDVAAASSGLTVSGVLLEKQDADPDSYLLLRTDQGEVWARIPMAGLIIGSNVTVVGAQEMRQWESARLQKTFDRLYLGRLEMQSPAVPADSTRGGVNAMSQDTTHAVAQMGDTGLLEDAGVSKLPKAPGADGRTVEEIVTNGQSLQGKIVSVRGQAVKVTSGLRVPNIAGGVWVHIQDGSGSQAKGTHRLTIATDEAVNVGDVLVFRGTVKIDDTGMLGGRVIVQGAKKL